VLFTRPCERCGEPFDYCGSCQPGRLYHGEACSRAAREESAQAARAKYNDRESEEGREAHRLEEADRRDRHARECVGDHRLQALAGTLQVPSSAAYQAAAEVRDGALTIPAAPPTLGVPGRCAGSAEPQVDTARPTLTEWTLVAWPELLPAARRRLGTEAPCPFCGRRGRIVRVVSRDEWRRRVRYGFG
jgi:hypothetical protein